MARTRTRWTTSKDNVVLRIGLTLFFLSMLFFYEDLITHTRAHFLGSVLDIMIEGQWHVVVLNIVVFVSFLVPLSYRRKVDWKEYGIVVAFFVSLFIEMYGIPLTIMFTSKYLAPAVPVTIHHVLTIELLGVEFAFTVPMVYGTLLMALGTALIIIGWVTLYKNIKKKGLVTTGIYRVTRNPQYLGFILVVLGWLIGWPTVLVVIFSVILLLMYMRLCKVEEDEVSGLPGFEGYKKKVPLLL